MPQQVPQAVYDSTARQLLASSATMLAAERRSYASIEAAYNGTVSDAYANLTKVAASLDALATTLRS